MANDAPRDPRAHTAPRDPRAYGGFPPPSPDLGGAGLAELQDRSVDVQGAPPGMVFSSALTGRRKIGGVVAAVAVVALAAVLTLAAIAGIDPSTPGFPDDPIEYVTGDDPEYTAPAKALEVLESGWSIEEGYLHYTVVIRNPNPDVRIDFPTLTVTGRDKSGRILFSEDAMLATVLADSTTAVSTVASAGAQKPASVEFSLTVPEDIGWVRSDVRVQDVYKVFNTSWVPGQYGGKVTGEVKLKGEGESSVALVAVARDKAGKIVGGETVYADGLVRGIAKPFSIDLFGVRSADSFDVYVQPW